MAGLLNKHNLIKVSAGWMAIGRLLLQQVSVTYLGMFHQSFYLIPAMLAICCGCVKEIVLRTLTAHFARVTLSLAR